MAFPVVASITPSHFTTQVTTHNVLMPATVNAGDLLLMIVSATGSTSFTLTPPSGWTAAGLGVSGTNFRSASYVKDAVGNEDGTTVNVATTQITRMEAQVYRITGWSGDLRDQIIPPQPSSIVNNLNPPSHAPPWAQADTLWISVLTWRDTASNCTVTGYPASYSGGGTAVTGGGTAGAGIASAWRQLNALTEDPGAFIMSATPSSHAAQCIGIPPVGVNTAPQVQAINATYSSGTVAKPGVTWGVNYTVNDYEQTGTNALLIDIGTSQGGNDILGNQTATSGTPGSGSGFSHTLLAQGNNTIWLRVRDGTNSTNQSVNVVRSDPIPATSRLVLPFPVMSAAGTHTVLAATGVSRLVLPFPSMSAAGAHHPRPIATSVLTLPFPRLSAAAIQRIIAGGQHNLCTNPHFETDINPWAVIIGGEILSRNTTDSRTGIASLEVLTNGTIFQGAQYVNFDAKPTQGTTTTARAWVKAKTAGDIGKQVRLILGAAGTGEETGVDITLSASWQQISATKKWTQAGGTGIFMHLRDVWSVAVNFLIDDVEIIQVGGDVLTLPFPRLSGAGSHTDIQAASILTIPFPVLQTTAILENILGPYNTIGYGGWPYDSYPLLEIPPVISDAVSLTIPFPMMFAAGVQRIPSTTTRLITPFPVMAASGRPAFKSTSILTLPTPVMKSAGLEKGIGISRLINPFPVLYTSGKQRDIGVARLILPAPIMSTTGKQRDIGVARLILPSPIMVSTGRQKDIATARLISPFPVMYSQGAHYDIQGVSRLIVPFPVMNTAGFVEGGARSYLIAPFPMMSTLGRQRDIGQGRFILPFPILQTAALQRIIAQARLITPFPMMVSSGRSTFKGQGRFILPTPLMYSQGRQEYASQAIILTLPSPILRGLGNVPTQGRAYLILPFPILTATGIQIPPILIIYESTLEIPDYTKVIPIPEYSFILQTPDHSTSIPIEPSDLTLPIPDHKQTRSL